MSYYYPPCSQYVYGTPEYNNCMALQGIAGMALQRGSGGSPFSIEASALVKQFINLMGFGPEVELPEGTLPDAEALLDIIDNVRELGELETAFSLNDFMTHWLTSTELPNANALVVRTLNTRARLLNGLGRPGEARHTLDMVNVINRTP